jgi:hypothetical protein
LNQNCISKFIVFWEFEELTDDLSEKLDEQVIERMKQNLYKTGRKFISDDFEIRKGSTADDFCLSVA